jgi:dihydrofolate reductase
MTLSPETEKEKPMNSKNTFKAIAAMSENRVIGSSGDLPWHLPEEFAWFKKKTMGGVLVMGRKTFDSIGRPLPGRETYVLSRQPRDIPGAHSFTDLAALDHLKTDKTIWIAGGAEVYRQMLPKLDEIFLTRVHREVEGDTFFPEFEDAFTREDIIEQNEQFTIEHWIRTMP